MELKDKDGLARTGIIETRHGRVSTPNLAPVIHPLVQSIKAKELRERFRADMVMTNAYILWRSDLKDRALENGLHGILDFEGPIMTDSGAFQSHVYGDLAVTNHDIVTYQRRIGSDFGTVLDIFSEPEHSHHKTERDIGETLNRTREAESLKGDMPLVGAVQGSIYPDLREMCARELSSIDVSVHAIGGVVPLMETYRFRDLVAVIVASKRGLRVDKPVHLFGAGHPMVFALAALLGCDLFDSSSYEKYARAGRMMFVDGTRHIEETEVLPCDCPVCSVHDARELEADRGLLARHNLYESFREIRMIRQAIKAGEMWELVERRCRNHPALLDALRELRKHADFLEKFEPVSRPGALFFSGPDSIYRPSLQRLRRLILERYTPPSKQLLVILPEGAKPYSRKRTWETEAVRGIGGHVIVKSALGPVPIELDEFYPFSQSMVPDALDVETTEAAEVFTQQYVRAHSYVRGVNWSGPDTLKEVSSTAAGPALSDIDMLRARAVADVQFGRDAADVLLGGRIEFVVSPNTGRIRNVMRDGVHILSMRAHDGMFTLRPEGGTLLHKSFPPPAMRVVVEKDTAEFNRQGKNVFAKFVLDCDPELRTGDECLVVDQSDGLVAVGRLFMNRDEMLSFERGVAVHVRDGCPQPP